MKKLLIELFILIILISTLKLFSSCSHHKNDWFKGQDRPYEKILIDLTKQGYNLTNYKDETPDRKILSIQLSNEWNMEDVNKIKSIIMKTFHFEPKIGISHIPDGREITSMIWTGSKYDVYIHESAFDKIIHLSFETK